VILIVMLAMIAVAATVVSVPLLRNQETRRADPTAAVVRSQFAEAEPAPEAARRLLAEAPVAEARTRTLGRGGRYALTAAIVAVFVVGTFGIYILVGQPELAGPPPPSPVAAPRPDLTAELEQRALSAPGDATSWNRLGLAYQNADRFADAALVFARAATLDPNAAAYPSAEGEALTQAANGKVTTGAREAFRAALTIEPSDPRARFYLALAKDQAGDHAGAQRDWASLIQSAPADAPWLPQVRASIARLRVRSGNQ
jgi:cytochrome c-type biogenesis protein CcmH